MAELFTLVIDDAPPDFGGGNPQGERQQLVGILRSVAERLGDGVSLDGEIPDPNGADRDHIGHWLYVPVAGVPVPPEPPPEAKK